MNHHGAKNERRFLCQRVAAICVSLCVMNSLKAGPQDSGAAGKITVLPLALVAADQAVPAELQASSWMKHLKWTQRYFAERLNGDTFQLATEQPTIVRLRRPLSFYKGLKKGEAATYWTAELLDHFKLNRFDCPYTFCCLVMNPRERWPIGGGRSINGGINRGGGMLVMSSFPLDKLPNFQSTLRHEIAHTVGLPHVDVYGYDMKTTRSLMAYNTMHQTNRFRESKTGSPDSRRRRHRCHPTMRSGS